MNQIIITDPFRPGKLKKTSGPFRCGICRSTFNSLAECRGCKDTFNLLLQIHVRRYKEDDYIVEDETGDDGLRPSLQIQFSLSWCGHSLGPTATHTHTHTHPFSLDGFHGTEQQFQLLHRDTVAGQHAKHFNQQI